MRILPLLSATIGGLTAYVTSTVASGIEPAAPPKFETLFYGVLQVTGQVDTANATFGTRINGVISSANFTDPSGNLVATLASSTADTGVIASSGIFFPEAVLALRWAVDQKFAYLRATGVGTAFGSSLLYGHMETDSETYSSLNGRFLVVNVNFPGGQGSSPTLTLFGAS